MEQCAACLLTLSKVKKLVIFYIPSWNNGELDNHLYLAENTSFSKKDNSKFDGYWLETPEIQCQVMDGLFIQLQDVFIV